MSEFLEKWTAYILAGATGIIGLFWGMKRAQIGNTYRLTQIEREIRDLETRVKALEAQGVAEAISLSRIQATLDNVLEYLQDLKQEIRGKMDK